MPKIIALRNLPQQQRHTLLDSIHEAVKLGDQPPVALFVKTNAELKSFLHQWNVAQVCDLKNGHKAWLRLHDTRVLHQMLRVLKPSQRPRFFSNAESLIYFIADEWITYFLPTDALCDSQTATKNAELSGGIFEPLSWDRIYRIGLINRALLGASIRNASALTSQGALAEQLIERAERLYGLSDTSDLVEFATRGLTIGSKFDEHPRIAAAIRPITSSGEDSSLADRLAIIGEHVWGELRQSSQPQ